MLDRLQRWAVPLAWLILLGGAAWLATHPSLLAPQLSKLATRHFLRDGAGDLRVRGFRGNILDRMELIDVALTLRGERGAVALVAVDTLVLDYEPRDLLRSPLRFRSVELRGAEIHARRGREPEEPRERDVGGPFELPHLRIDDLSVSRSWCEISGPRGRLEQRLPQIVWRGAVISDSTLTVVSEGSDIVWETRDIRLRDLHGRFVVDNDRIAINRADLMVNEALIQCDGSRYHDGRLDLSLRGRGISAAEIEDAVDLNLGFAARGDVEIDLISRADTLTLDVLFDGELEGYRLVGFSGLADLTPGILNWRRMRGRIDEALFDGTGYFDLEDPYDVVFELAGNVSDVDISSGLVPEEGLPPTDGYGWIELWRRDRTNDTIVGGWLAEGYIADVPFDTCFVDIASDDSGVLFRRLGLKLAAGEALLTGFQDAGGGFSGDLTVAAADLAQLPPQWNLPEMDGRLAAGGALTGADDDFTFAGEALLMGAGLESLAADTCRVGVEVEDVLGDPKFSLDMSGSGLTVAGLPLGDFEASGVVTGEVARLHSFSSARGDTQLTLRGQATFSDSLTTCYVPELDLQLENNTWSLDDALRLSIAPDVLRIRDVTLRSELGEISCGLVSDRAAASLGGGIECRGFDLSMLNPFLEGDADLNGMMTAEAAFGGSPDSPQLDVEATLLDAEFPLAHIDSLRVSAHYGGGRVAIRGLDLATDQGTVFLSGEVANPDAPLESFWRGAELDLDLRARGCDWAFVDQFGIPSLDRIAGGFDADLRVGGTTEQPLIDGEVSSAPFNIHWAHLDELSGGLSYEPGQLVLSDLRGRKGEIPVAGRLEVPLRLDFLSEPVSPPDGPLYMRLTIPDGTDITPLAGMTNAFIETGGAGGIELVVAGPADHPHYSGRVSVRDGSCVLRGLGEIYREVDIDGSFSGDVLTIERIEGLEGQRGTFAGDGVVVFDGLELEGFDIRLAADRFLVASIPELRVLVRTPELHLEGVKVGPDSLIVPRFTGDLEVIEARYVGDFSEKAGVSDPRLGTVAPDWLADLDLRAAPRSGRIVNRAMELYLGGDVRLVRDLEGLYLRGTMQVDAGRMPVFNNDFKVTQGRLDFSREVGVVPRIEMTAETQVRLPAYDGGSRRLERIYVDVTGTADRPLVDFRSESGYPRSNIERMLLGLSPYATDTQTTTGLQTASVAAGFNLLEREIAQELDMVDTFDIESGREKVDGTTQTLIGVGKYIGRDLYIRYAQALSDPDRDFLVEYQISDHLLLQSEISQRQEDYLGNTTYSVDMKYRFEY